MRIERVGYGLVNYTPDFPALRFFQQKNTVFVVTLDTFVKAVFYKKVDAIDFCGDFFTNRRTLSIVNNVSETVTIVWSLDIKDKLKITEKEVE